MTKYFHNRKKKDYQVTHNQLRLILTSNKTKYILDTIKPVIEFCKQGLKTKVLQIMLNSTSSSSATSPPPLTSSSTSPTPLVSPPTPILAYKDAPAMEDKVFAPPFTSTATQREMDAAGQSHINIIKCPKESTSKKDKLKSLKTEKRRHDAKSADLTESDSNDQDSTSSDSEEEMHQVKMLGMLLDTLGNGKATKDFKKKAKRIKNKVKRQRLPPL